MTMIGRGQAMPEWCRLKAITDIRPNVGEMTAIVSNWPQARLLVLEGSFLVKVGERETSLREHQFLDLLPETDSFAATALTSTAKALVFEGNWGNSVGGCGVFEYTARTPNRWEGDPVDYPKHTSFDSHYHDFDEYFFILDGEAEIVVGAHRHFARSGDCVAIGMGHHHDIPSISGTLRSAYFHGPLEGKRRHGHLWVHTNGPACPIADRI